MGLTVDSANRRLYVADSGNNAIRQVVLDDASYPVNVIVDDPLLNTPYGVVVDASNPAVPILYVTSFNGHAVFQIYLNGDAPVSISTSSIFVGSTNGKCVASLLLLLLYLNGCWLCLVCGYSRVSC